MHEPSKLLERLKSCDTDFEVLARHSGIPKIDHKSTLENLDNYARITNHHFRNFIEFEAGVCKINIEDLLALHHEQMVSITANITDSERIESFKNSEAFFGALKQRSPDRYMLITKAALMISGSAHEPHQELLSEIFDRITELKNNPEQWQKAVSKGAILLDTTRSRQEKVEALLPRSVGISLLKTYQRDFGFS